jgi:hypothetical protein
MHYLILSTLGLICVVAQSNVNITSTEIVLIQSSKNITTINEAPATVNINKNMNIIKKICIITVVVAGVILSIVVIGVLVRRHQAKIKSDEAAKAKELESIEESSEKASSEK